MMRVGGECKMIVLLVRWCDGVGGVLRFLLRRLAMRIDGGAMSG